MKRLSKDFIITSSVLIVLLVVVVGVSLPTDEKNVVVPADQGTPVNVIPAPEAQIPVTDVSVDQMQNWQTYTNTEYGFQVKHPTNLSVVASNLAYDPEFEVCLVESPYQNYCTSTISDQKTDEKIQILISKISAGNNAGLLKAYSSSDGYTVLTTQNTNYFFSFVSKNSQSEILGKIFTTFVPVPIENFVTQEWQTYTNAEYGFELRYPKFFGEFVKQSGPVWLASSYPLPSKPANLSVTLFYAYAPDQILFRNFGTAVRFDYDRKQFFLTDQYHGSDSESERSYVEKKFSNGNLFYQTSEGEGNDSGWGVTTAIFVFDEARNLIFKLETSNSHRTYNGGPKLEAIFSTFKLLRG